MRHLRGMSEPLPPYRGIFAVDTVRFTANPSARQPDLSATIQRVLKVTFERCQLPGIWEQRRFPQGTGDGYLFGTMPTDVPFLLHPVLDTLHDVLAETDEELRALDRALRLRLRVSVNIGPVPDAGDELRDRIGTPTNVACRLLDSTALRDALNRSNHDVTLLAAIVSQRVFDDVVRGGYTSVLHPDRFDQVTAEVPGKDFAEPAWIYVPRPSRSSAPETQAATATLVDSSEPPKAGRFYQNTGAGQQINADTISAPITYGGRSS